MSKEKLEMSISVVKLGILTWALTGVDLLLEPASTAVFGSQVQPKSVMTKAQYYKGPVHRRSNTTNLW